MFLLRQIPQACVPCVLIAIGAFLILCGTVLYWPAERLGARMDRNDKYWNDWTYRTTRRVSLWVNNSRPRRLIVRGAPVAMGIDGLARGLWLLFA